MLLLAFASSWITRVYVAGSKIRFAPKTSSEGVQSEGCSEGKHQALASDELIQFGIVLIPTPSLIGVRVGPIPTTHDRAASLGPATRTHLRARNAY